MSAPKDDSPAPFQADLPRMERAVREILAAVGEDPDRNGLLETPARVARMYAELSLQNDIFKEALQKKW